MKKILLFLIILNLTVSCNSQISENNKIKTDLNNIFEHIKNNDLDKLLQLSITQSKIEEIRNDEILRLSNKNEYKIAFKQFYKKYLEKNNMSDKQIDKQIDDFIDNQKKKLEKPSEINIFVKEYSVDKNKNFTAQEYMPLITEKGKLQPFLHTVKLKYINLIQGLLFGFGQRGELYFSLKNGNEEECFYTTIIFMKLKDKNYYFLGEIRHIDNFDNCNTIRKTENQNIIDFRD